jgi:hypothetical protein
MNGICGPRAVSSTFHLREKGLAEVVPGEVDDTGLLDAFGLAEAEAVDLVELLPFADVDDVTDPVATALLAFPRSFRGFLFVSRKLLPQLLRLDGALRLPLVG